MPELLLTAHADHPDTMKTPHLALCLLAHAARATYAQSPVGARVDSVLTAYERQGFSGAIRIERLGTVLLEKGYGMANRAAGTRFSPATIVQIGSNTKDFTTVAILQLVSRGVLALTDSLARFFPDAPADKKAITIRQLLNHRSGLPANLGGDFDPVDRTAFLANAMQAKVLFAPGTEERYSNAGFSVLAAIIEMVSHKDYDTFIHDNIIAPAGLTHTGYLLPRFDSRDVARGLRANGTENPAMVDRPHASDGHYWNLRGNGGMLSTLDDMHEFYHVLFDTDRLLPPAVRNPYFDPSEPVGLAGSDGVSLFAFDRYPRLQLEVILVTTNAKLTGHVVRPAIERAIGLAP